MPKPANTRPKLEPHVRPVRQTHFFSLRIDPQDVLQKQRAIYDTLIREAVYLGDGNFQMIAIKDLRKLFQLYDALFFNNLIAPMVQEDGGKGLELRFSKQLTRAAGKTFMHRKSIPSVLGTLYETRYEIAISTLLLFESFENGGREITIGGLVCRNRLEALQRIFEHELIHLIEFMSWGKSSCSAPNYKYLAGRIFGHTDVHHDLVTRREIAEAQHGVKVGDIVQFDINGIRLTGRVNRITKRASILVADPKGRVYSDGNSYLTYYVPLSMLDKGVS